MDQRVALLRWTPKTNKKIFQLIYKFRNKKYNVVYKYMRQFKND